jgi:predicted permease
MGFVLLVASSNVANLFSVRAEARTRDTAVRMALGSGRARLVRLLLTEGVLLGATGGSAGVLLAYAAVRALVAAQPASIPRLDEIGINASVLAFTAGTSVAVGLLVALMPALRTGSPRMLRSLRGGGRTGPLGRERYRGRNALVVLQVAVALALFVGSTLMVRTFGELRAVDPGFRPEAVLTFRVSPSPVRYEEPEAVARFYDQLLDDLRALPGISTAGAIDTLPLTGGGSILTTLIEEYPPAEDEFPPVFLFRRAAPGYFEAMGIPLVEGRTFTADDHGRRLGSLVISKSIKDRYWPEVSALGKRITVAGAPGTVVGVVGDVHDAGLDTPAEQFVYKPMLDETGGGVRDMTVTLRSDLDSLATFPAAARRVIESIDRELPVTDMRSMQTVVGDSLSRTSFTATVLAAAAAIALFLGAVGIYGVISYGVSQRRGEIGLRQVLGATPGSIRWHILRNGVWLGGAGVVLGIAGAVVLGRLLASLLYGVGPYDPVALASGAVVFLGVAALASILPATRAARIPPAVALSDE